MANTSIGTAWIQIKPSTKGLRTAVESGLNGKEIGASFGKSFSSAAAGVAAGVASKIAGTVMSQVKSSFDSAITRVDTLNNFANVMGNLNIGAEESQSAINKLSDKLTGLPTRLDDAASAVQRFTTKNSNVAKSTDMFLALNNALLAGGASADLQSNALEQISQAYAKGKPDMVEWRSILQSMPAQATQIGKAFGMTADELGEALRTGTLSMDDFMDKVMELNTNGANGFKSFEEQAKAATDTIQTKMANVSTSITKVVAAALNGEDMSKPIQQLTDRIVEIAPQLITGFVNAFLGLAQAIPQIIPPVLEALVAQAPAFIQAFTDIIVKVAEALPQIILILAQALPSIIQAIVSAIPQIINAIVNSLLNPDFLSSIFQAGIQLFLQLALAIPDIIVALIDALPDIITNIVDFLTNPDNILMIIDAAVQLFMGLVEAIPKILVALINAFVKLFSNLWERVKKLFTDFAAKFGETIAGVFKGAINKVLEFIENFINAPIKLINKFIDLINSAFGWIGVNIGQIGLVHLPRLAKGGIVRGVGTDTSDSNLYALSKGEYVVRASAARQIGYDNLDRMNETGTVSNNQTINFTINGYDKDPNELANIISRKIAFNRQGVMA